MYYSALIGNPVEHSISHVLFELLAREAKLGFPYKHLKIKVAPEKLRQSLDAFQILGFRGINVTLPYKLDIIEHVDELDPVINDIGAINTVIFKSTSSIGTNTDWYGILRSVKEFGGDYDLRKATILGTGGAARAAIYACNQLGVGRIIVLFRGNPLSSNTSLLLKDVEKLGIEMKPYDDLEKTINESDIIINATSAGMKGMDELPFDTGRIKAVNLDSKLYFDAVFNPINTPLLRYFAKRGALTIDGLWMMIYQAVLALEYWTGSKIDISTANLKKIHAELREGLLND